MHIYNKHNGTECPPPPPLLHTTPPPSVESVHVQEEYQYHTLIRVSLHISRPNLILHQQCGASNVKTWTCG